MVGPLWNSTPGLNPKIAREIMPGIIRIADIRKNQ